MATEWPVDLKLFFKRLCPLRYNAYMKWRDPDAGIWSIHSVARRRGTIAALRKERIIPYMAIITNTEIEAILEDGNLSSSEFNIFRRRKIYLRQISNSFYEVEEKCHQDEVRWLRTKSLELWIYMVKKLREALQSGQYEITAKISAGERITLTADDIRALDISIDDNALVGRSYVYEQVLIKPMQANESVHDAPATVPDHSAEAPAKRRKPGRPPGAGGIRSDDELIVEVIAMQAADRDLSNAAAVDRVVDRAKGDGTRESTVRRLTGKLAKRR